jgi:hypothetical protein
MARVLSVHVSAESSASPEKVLGAASDFSDRRGEVWPNVSAKHTTVHERGEGFAEVTEGTNVIGLFWERNRYEWSKPGSVKGTVIDSNVMTPGSTWELRASPSDGGSRVEMIIQRGFQRGVRGRVASAFNHMGGSRAWGSYLRRALAAIEKQSD